MEFPQGFTPEIVRSFNYEIAGTHQINPSNFNDKTQAGTDPNIAIDLKKIARSRPEPTPMPTRLHMSSRTMAHRRVLTDQQPSSSTVTVPGPQGEI